MTLVRPPAETAKPAGRSAWPTKAVPRHCSGQCRHSGENHRRQSLGMTNEQNLSRLFHSSGGASNAESGAAAILRGLLLEHDHAPPRAEELRVGKEGGRTVSARGTREHQKKK